MNLNKRRNLKNKKNKFCYKQEKEEKMYILNLSEPGVVLIALILTTICIIIGKEKKMSTFD